MLYLLVHFFVVFAAVDSKPWNPRTFGDYARHPSESTGEMVSGWNETLKVNPEEMGEYFEGDIMVSNAKNGLLDENARWENGIVPYVIGGPYKKEDLDMIFAAMGKYHVNTCIRFRRKTKEDVDYLNIQNTKTGCWSNVGKTGGKQDLNLQSPGCVSTLGTPVHEFMHALGFHHEQSRWERDDFVSILWANVASGREGNFEKVKDGTSTDFGVSYDYGSVMHYSKYAFSKNQKPTIEPKEKDVVLGQRKGFSKGDLQKVNAMYKCDEVDVGNLTTEKPDYNVVGTSNILTEIVDAILG